MTARRAINETKVKLNCETFTLTLKEDIKVNELIECHQVVELISS